MGDTERGVDTIPAFRASDKLSRLKRNEVPTYYIYFYV